MYKALFLDRDGVVNEDYHYPHKPEHIRFREGIFELCRAAAAKGYMLIIVTNQAGVAKGKFTEEDVRSLHDWMNEQFRREGIEIAGFYFCPFHADGIVEEYRKDSDMRKPKPGMFLQAAKEHGIDLSQSVVLGDKQSDRIECAGLKSIVVKSQYTQSGYDAESLDDIEKLL
jgi:D-glycero-D-manno-heptose 1,7-bisphosphate phosphatase